jgi:hypothetical protein
MQYLCKTLDTVCKPADFFDVFDVNPLPQTLSIENTCVGNLGNYPSNPPRLCLKRWQSVAIHFHLCEMQIVDGFGAPKPGPWLFSWTHCWTGTDCLDLSIFSEMKFQKCSEKLNATSNKLLTV